MDRLMGRSPSVPDYLCVAAAKRKTDQQLKTEIPKEGHPCAGLIAISFLMWLLPCFW